jgi:ATP-dependent helicase HrpA
MSILALWHGVHSGLSGLSLRKQISWCHERFLSHARFREWRDLHQQLSEVCQDIGWDILKTLDHPDIIHQCLLTGLLSQIAYKDPQSKTFEYIAPRGLRVVIHPGSSLKKKSPQWIMAAEWLDTSRPFARIVAPIMPEWLEQIAGHLVHKSYLDPRFDAKRGEVVATAKISLYGLHILTHAQVSYGRVDPIKAREVFIRQALVEGLYPKKQANFYVHNQSVYESIETLEHKTRQDWLDWDDVLFAFYDEKIPNECVDVVSFVAWQKHHDSQLHLSLELILDSLSKHQAEEQFPEQFLIDGSPLALRYRFEPRHELDGVTLLCPLSWLNRLRAERLEWLVPGMIREKIFLLLKNLPKDQRRALMPLEQSVTQFLSSGIVMDHGLCDQLAVWVGKHTGQRIRIHPEDFHPEQLPIHMFMRIEILDETGHELASSRNLLELQTRLGEAAQLSFRQDHTDEYERIGVERWDFGDLPQVIHTSHGMQAYPALSMMPDGRLALKALDTLELATKEHAHGVLALLMLSLPAQIKQIQKNWVSVKQASLAWRLNDLSDDAVYFLLRQAALADGACVPRTMVEFEAMRERVKVRLPSLVHGFDIILNDVRQKYSVLNDMITKHHPLRSCFDAWMAQLFVPRFLRTMPWHIWQSMPRYLSAWHIRIQKYSGRILRDAEEQKQVDRLLHAYAKACQQLHQKYQEVPEALEEFRWECEELRVSLWAQELKTPRPVSVKRLEKFWMQQGFDRWVRLSS